MEDERVHFGDATIGSWFAFAENKAHATYCMNELDRKLRIDFAPDACNMDVDHVVERCSAVQCFPHVASEHFARDQLFWCRIRYSSNSNSRVRRSSG